MKLLCLLICLATQAPFIPMKWEQLPDLDIPRAGHQSFVADGELVVVGGHTTGFVRTATAEYLSGGKWHARKTIYPCDNSFLLKLPNGDYLIGGGCDGDFGVGQTYSVQRYSPLEHDFFPFPILDSKRSLATAVLLGNGNILVSGNWYSEDAVEASDGSAPFETILKTSQNRSRPYIFPYGKDNAVIFSSYDIHGERLPVILVDSLDGEPYTPELFEQWIPYEDSCLLNGIDKFKAINPSTGQVAFFFSAMEKGGSRPALLSFSDGVFAKVRTDMEIPEEGVGGAISWTLGVYVDQRRGTAYMIGADHGLRVYIAAVNYLPFFDGKEAAVKVFFSDPVEDLSIGTWNILPDGRLVLCGGYKMFDHMGNYLPSSRVLAFSPFEEDSLLSTEPVRKDRWPLAIIGMLLISLIFAGLFFRKREKSSKEPAPVRTEEKAHALFLQVKELMEEKKLYRKNGLSVSDIATRLGSNTKYISSCINAEAGCSFVEFVNGYRIKEAQEIIKRQPSVRMAEVYEAVGFSNESSFFRNFRHLTGKTPSQWMEELIR